MKKAVDAQLIRDILSAFGFADERIDAALHDLLADSVQHVTTPPVDRILTFKQACELLALSKSGLRRIINTGEITPVHLSERRIGFRQTDIAAFVQTRQPHTSKTAEHDDR